MEAMVRRLPALAGIGVLLWSSVGLVAREAMQDASRQQAEALAVKLAAIADRGELPPIPGVPPAPPVRTTLTEREANAYFAHFGAEILPPGVVDPRVTIGEGNRVTGRAVVDLDAVRKSKTRGWLDPLGYVTGSLEVTMAGRLYASNGVGLIRFESATVGGVSVSESLLQELITYYTATPETPRGYRLGELSPLPANIRAVELKPGVAVVVQ
jgi:hypothetical protein